MSRLEGCVEVHAWMVNDRAPLETGAPGADSTRTAGPADAFADWLGILAAVELEGGNEDFDLDPDEPDDEPAGSWVHPDDRIWRHPSEIGKYGTASSAPSPVPPTHRRGVPLALRVLLPLAAGVLFGIGGSFVAQVVGTHGAAGHTRAGSSTLASPVHELVDDPAPRSVAANVASQSAPGLVTVEVSTSSTKRVGAGVVFRPDGMVLTTAALVGSARHIVVRDAQGMTYPARLVGIDLPTDTAVVSVGVRKMQTAALSTVPLAGGERVWEVALPEAQPTPARVLPTKVASVDASVSSGDMVSLASSVLVADPPVPARSVPSVVVGSDGAVRALVVGTTATKGSPDLVCTPVAETLWAAEELIDAGRVPHGWLGVTLAATSTETEAARQIGTSGLLEFHRHQEGPGELGVLVVGVEASSPAAAAGLRAGDDVLALNGQDIDSARELAAVVESFPPGAKVSLTVQLPSGSRERVAVTLGADP
jgi:S1-C subfamily serine protease